MHKKTRPARAGRARPGILALWLLLEKLADAFVGSRPRFYQKRYSPLTETTLGLRSR
jgi:hypothetical protein